MPRPLPPPKFESSYRLPTDLRRAIRRREWSSVERGFAGLPSGQDPTWWVLAAADIAGSERFYRAAVDRTSGSALALTLYGARLVVVAWRYRTGKYARFVTRHQFQEFHEHLAEAEQVLADATAAEPDSVAAWTARLQTGRGLSFGPDELDRRYARAAADHPHPLCAQRQLLQGLCPKWGGTFERVHSFTATAATAAPPATPHAALVAEGYLEQLLTMGRDRLDYARVARVKDAVAAAAARSVLHPDAREQPGWVWGHSVFAAYYAVAGMYKEAEPHFRILGRRAHRDVWSRVSGRPARVWRLARNGGAL